MNAEHLSRSRNLLPGLKSRYRATAGRMRAAFLSQPRGETLRPSARLAPLRVLAIQPLLLMLLLLVLGFILALTTLQLLKTPGFESMPSIRAPPPWHLGGDGLLGIPQMRGSRLFTLNELLQRTGYKASRQGRACSPIPADAVIDPENTFRVGVVREFYGGMYDRHHCWRGARWQEVRHQSALNSPRAAAHPKDASGAALGALGGEAMKEEEATAESHLSEDSGLPLVLDLEAAIRKADSSGWRRMVDRSRKVSNAEALRRFEDGLDVNHLRSVHCASKHMPIPWRVRQHEGDPEVTPDPGGDAGVRAGKVDLQVRAQFGFVLIVTSHRYVDGAIVLADSLRQRSELSQRGLADIVLIISENIREELYPTLRACFDRVIVVSSLQSHARKSYFMATFDKLYVFYLTEYKSVMFVDADSVALGEIDHLVTAPHNVKKLLQGGVVGIGASKNDNWDAIKHCIPLNISTWSTLQRAYALGKPWQPLLYVIGGSTYFQSTLMVLEPRIDIFLDLMLEFWYHQAEYNRWNGRDGSLIRTCFSSSVAPLRVSSSPPPVYHFLGRVKPWFNTEHADAAYYEYFVAHADYLATGIPDVTDFLRSKAKAAANKTAPMYWSSVEAGIQYDWWTRYESIHKHTLSEVILEDRRVHGSQQLALVHQVRQHLALRKLTSIPSDTCITRFGGAALVRVATAAVPRSIGLGESAEAADHATEREYMWLQRFDEDSEYLKPTRQRMWSLYNHQNLSRLIAASSGGEGFGAVPHAIPTVHIVVGAMHRIPPNESAQGGAPPHLRQFPWANCNTVCAQHGLEARSSSGGTEFHCDPVVLLHSSVGSSTPSPFSTDGRGSTLAFGQIRCDRCIPVFDSSPAPFVGWRRRRDSISEIHAASPSGDGDEGAEEVLCYFNAWRRFKLPRCNAAAPTQSLLKTDALNRYAPVCACVSW